MIRGRERRTLAVFAATLATIVLCGKVVFPNLAGTIPIPNGLYVQGTVLGLLSALLAIGLLLVYRTTRIINFAQGALGAVAATLSVGLVAIYDVPYFLAIAIGLAAGVGASLFSEWAFIRRFAKAPRLLLTVSTIALAQVLDVVELLPLRWAKRSALREFFTEFHSPFRGAFTFGHYRFTGDHVVAVVAAAAALAGVYLFLTRTRYGIAARAAAENEMRTRLVGCPIRRVSFVVWGVAGLLSALTAILRTPILLFQLGALQGPDLLLRALAAATLAGMGSIPLTALAAIVITIGEQTLFFSFGATGLTDAFLLGIVVLGLLMQERRVGLLGSDLSSWRAVQPVRPVPRELIRVRLVVWGRRAVRLFPFGCLVALPLALTDATASLVSAVFVYAMVGVSLVVLTGWGGNISLGQWAVAGIGALVAQKLAVRAPPLDFFLILLIAGLCGALTLVVIGIPALRARALLLGITTLAFAIAGTNWIFQWRILTVDDTIVRPALFGFMNIDGERSFYYVALAGLIFALYAASNLRRSRWGRNIVAGRDNETEAQALGIRLLGSRVASIAISGFIAGLAGALYAYTAQTVSYSSFFPIQSLQMFSMVVIGGVGSLTGAILGAVYLRGVMYFLPYNFQVLTTGFGVVLVLWLFPGGLGQIVLSLRDRLLRAAAVRRGIHVPALVADRRTATSPVYAPDADHIAHEVALR